VSAAQGPRKGSPAGDVTSPQEIRRRWDERAARDSFHYIVTRPDAWDEASFFASGERDYLLTVEPRIPALGLHPESATMLEVGCGVGRMTRSFSERFRRVVAVDASLEMLRRGRALHPNAPTIGWVLTSGADLRPIRSESMDFVYSFLVLQHVPDRRIALGYVGEMLRVLKRGGTFAFQFRSAREPSALGVKGRLLQPAIEWLREPILGIRLQDRIDRLLVARGHDPLKSDRTWSGVLLDVRRVLERVWAGGGSVLGVDGWGTPFTWCMGVKA